MQQIWQYREWRNSVKVIEKTNLYRVTVTIESMHFGIELNNEKEQLPRQSAYDIENQLKERWKLLYYPQMMLQPLATSPREITVTGIGEIVAQPDYAQIQIEVRTEGNNVSAAQQENAIIMNRVIESLIELNIPREAIKTTVYAVFPNYDFIEGRQVLRGYEVQNAVTVKITGIGQVGTVIDTAIKNGANHISAIQFNIVNANAYYRQALQFAMKDAMAKAKSIAKTMHVTLQALPVEIIEEPNTTAPLPYKSLQLSNQQYVTPIEPGRITVTATVRVKFRF